MCMFLCLWREFNTAFNLVWALYWWLLVVVCRCCRCLWLFVVVGLWVGLFVCVSVCLCVYVSVCVQHSDGQCEHTLRSPDSFLACCALSDLRFSFVTMSLAQVKTTVRVSPIMVAELA